jgi:hypothetical protein
MPPNVLFFIVNDRNIDVYRRIKKSCDIRFGVASQVLQAKHVMAASPQYISNVCMKVNAKLGGCTSVAKSAVIPKVAPKSSSIPTMVIGADVSHPAPGAGSGEAASFAAITVSADAYFAKSRPTAIVLRWSPPPTSTSTSDSWPRTGCSASVRAGRLSVSCIFAMVFQRDSSK